MTPSPEALRVPLLFIDPGQRADLLESLRSRFEVTEARSQTTAIRMLDVVHPAIVITELVLPEGGGLEICRAAKRKLVPPMVLVTTGEVEAAPSAILAGCDGVLLKPYAPNLLHSRLGRLLRDRAHHLQQRASLQNEKFAHLKIRLQPAASTGTNRVWSGKECPACRTGGAVSFDAAAHRRFWFACLHCRHVWLARSE